MIDAELNQVVIAEAWMNNVFLRSKYIGVILDA